MKTLKLILIALLGLAVSFAASASDTSSIVSRRLGNTAAITPGQWHRNFDKAKKYADSQGIPFVAVWSSGESCPHCVKFENCCNQTVFKNWQASSGIVFWFGYSGDSEFPVGCDEFHWARGNKNTSYPFVRLWWKKGSVDIATTGDAIEDYTSGSTGAKKVVSYMKAKFAKFKPTAAVSYTGGFFDCGTTAGDRLEAEEGLTTSVTIPLARTNATAKASVSTNYLVSVTADGVAATNMVLWAAGDAAATVTLPVSPVAGEKITLYLLNAAKKAIYTNAVACVAAQENSASNPYFVGAESDGLDFGEWSMDLDAVTNLAFNGKARTTGHAVILVGGSQWCKDCARTEKNLFNTSEFKAWAKANSVALGVVDIPSDPTKATSSACLLTRTVSANATDKDYYKETGLARTSGAGYLSRHMISDDAAQVVYDRNAQIATNSVLAGGWKALTSTKTRPGVPTLFLLRADGTLAGRFTAFAYVSPGSYDANYLSRLDEFLAQETLAEEESNDDYRTTAESLGKRASATATVSMSDLADVYRLEPETSGMRLKVSLTGPDAAKLSLSVISSAKSGSSTTVTNVFGLASEGLELTCKVPSTNSFVSVEVADFYASQTDSSSYFYPAKSESAIGTYTLSTDFILQPKEVAHTISVPEDGTVLFETVSNTVYVLEGVDASSLEGVFVESGVNAAGEKLYTALVTGDVGLTLTGTSFKFQVWNPGTVGFVAKGASVPESSGSYDLELVRTGGVSGSATLEVSFDALASSSLLGLYALAEEDGWTNGTASVRWEEGDAESKTLRVQILENAFADGSQALAFVAEAGADATLATDAFRLVIKDNDRAVSGKLAIVESEANPFAKSMTLIARVGSTPVKIGLARTGGADGGFDATLAASDGALNATTFHWDGRNADTQYAAWTVQTTPGRATVRLAAASATTKLDSDRKKLTIEIVDAAAPGFGTELLALPAYRYVPVEPATVAVTCAEGAEATLKVAKYSGSLPAGITWKFDAKAKAISFAGVPTVAGEYTCVFRATAAGKAGTVLKVKVTVADPVTGRAVTGGAAVAVSNASVRATTTSTDLPVVHSVSNRLVGLVTLTVPRTGRLSAKYRKTDKTVSLVSKNWASYDPETGVLKAVLTGTKASTAGYVLNVTVTPTATGALDAAVEVVDPDFETGALVCADATGTLWTKVAPATDYTGYYTASLPGPASLPENVLAGTPIACGDGYLTLKMNTTAAINAGKFAFAGVLPNGKAFSGSALLAPTYVGEGEETKLSFGTLPILTASTPDRVAGLVAIRPGAADKTASDTTADMTDCREGGRCSYELVRRSVYPYDAVRAGSAANAVDFVWEHSDTTLETSDTDASAYAVKLDPYGGLYVATDDFVNCCDTALGTSKLAFFAMGETLGETEYGTFVGWSTNKTTVTVKFTQGKTVAKNVNQLVLPTSVSYGLTLTFTQSTGLVRGTFKLPMSDGSVKVTYAAVVLPGWGSNSCTSCGMGGADAALRPFISGTAWFEDDGSYTYTTARGSVKALKVRRSCPVSIGVVAGE